MADGEEKIGLGGVGIHEGYTGDQAYSAGTPRDGKHGRPANCIGILRVMPARRPQSEIHSMLR